MTRILRRLRDESGIALVIALMSLVVLGIAVTSVISYTTTNQRSSNASRGRTSAFSLAEAGVSAASSVLNKTDAYNQNSLPLPGATPMTFTYENGGKADVWGTFDSSTATWTITSTATWTVTSTGSVPNPFGGAPLSRTTKALIHVHADPTQDANTTAWNFVFATGSDNNPKTCDVTFANTVTIDAPLYIAGDFCLTQSAQIVEPTSTRPVTLTVLGRLGLLGSNGVGVAGNPPQYITNANIGLGCVSTITATSAHACAPTGDYFYARNYSQTPTAITPPQMLDSDYQNEYNNASPGPSHPCSSVSKPTTLPVTASSSTVVSPLSNPASPSLLPVFDNDSTLNFTSYPNGSVSTGFNLTPSTGDYSCVTIDSWGDVIGYLAWDHTNKVLYVRGVIYIDGSAYVNINTAVSYSGVDHLGVHRSDGADGSGGMGTIYLSGTFTMSGGSTRLCGWNTTNNTPAITGTSCDFTNWTPKTSMLVIVAHGDDGSGNSISYSNAVQLQGGIFGRNAINLGSASNTEGPVIGSTIKATQSVTLNPLPYINSLPLGAPGNPNTHASPEPPVFISG